MQGNKLLPFHREIIKTFTGPSPDSDGLLLIARGLGLRTIVGSLLQHYDEPSKLVLLLNATEEEERSLSDDLGMRLRSIGYETPAKERTEAYAHGGIVSVTTRILVVDLLNKVCPTDKIKGVMVLHAEKVVPQSNEAFAIGLYRNFNKSGFLKAFSDEPERFNSGVAPLQNVLTQLKVRNTFIWPRFHSKVQEDLQKRKADVVELHQLMTPAMKEIQTALMECMEVTLNEIRRSSTGMEPEDLTVENALHRTFERALRSQVELEYNKVGPKTKSLVSDLGTLRRLLSHLTTFDCVSFNQYLETIVSANSGTTATGAQRRNQSSWLLLDAANTLLTVAKDRVYKVKSRSERAASAPADPDDEGYWGPSAEEEEMAFLALQGLEDVSSLPTNHAKGKDKARETWLPEHIEPVLEGHPKWYLLAKTLDEIESFLHWQPESSTNDTVLVMCSSPSTCSTLRDFLSNLDDLDQDVQDADLPMMRRRLRDYLFWKGALSKFTTQVTATTTNISAPTVNQAVAEESAALRRKREWKQGRAPANKRRRVRGGTSSQAGPGRGSLNSSDGQVEADLLDLSALTEQGAGEITALGSDAMPETLNEFDYDEYFGLCPPEDLVIIRSYQGDEDDRVLEELRPKYIVMYDPEPSFVRRVEVYRSMHAGMGVRVYFFLYEQSVEEEKFLRSLRMEKDAFEKLIRERSIMVVPLDVERRPGDTSNEELLRTISTRVGGGSKTATAEPPQVIVDVREFRSALPSMLYQSNIQVIPRTLTIGDYVLTPTVVVERKSIPDLIQSFNSGRLYQQCELMSIHYKQPVLLIEFDDKKAFTLEAYTEAKAPTSAHSNDVDLPSKLVLLTLSFPKLRIIWSSSPQATCAIFSDLKANHPEPDSEKASSIGSEEVGAIFAEGQFNLGPLEMLRSLPGVTSKNYRYVANHSQSVEALCDLPQDQLEVLIGSEPGKQLYKFLNTDALGRI